VSSDPRTTSCGECGVKDLAELEKFKRFLNRCNELEAAATTAKERAAAQSVAYVEIFGPQPVLEASPEAIEAWGQAADRATEKTLERLAEDAEDRDFAEEP
jgi:hypothetical protein